MLEVTAQPPSGKFPIWYAYAHHAPAAPAASLCLGEGCMVNGTDFGSKDETLNGTRNWLQVDTMIKPMQIREEQAEYRPNDNGSETRT